MSSGVADDEQQQQLPNSTKTTSSAANYHDKDVQLNQLSSVNASMAKNGGGEADGDHQTSPDLSNEIEKSKSKNDNKLPAVCNNEESNIPTPNSVVDAKEDSAQSEDEGMTTKHNDDTGNNDPNDTNGANTPISKRKDSEVPEDTPKPKRSRKLQGAGVKKPLYSRYESLYIVKAFKTISDRHPNLVLIDLFKIVGILFNEEANRQGFKERTSDQLYQKYKRIQHGLNHGETEYLDFFKQNKYNPKEWVPDFTNAGSDEILKYIKFPTLDDAIKEVLGSSIANLKPPLPDLYDDEDDDNLSVSHQTPVLNINEESKGEAAEEELLKLAGYNDGGENGSGSSITKQLKEKIKTLETSISVQDKEIQLLKESMHARDQEIAFLKNMIKEDLSYIRHKINEPAHQPSTTSPTGTSDPKALITPSSKPSS